MTPLSKNSGSNSTDHKKIKSQFFCTGILKDPNTLAQIAVPPPIRIGDRVTSWVQDPLSAYVIYQSRNLDDKNFILS